MVPLGTPISHILNQAGYEGSRTEFILGGPMMGPAVSAMDTPITKGTSGLLVLNEPSIENESHKIWPCIRCARCVKACPMHLNPSILGQMAAKRKYDEMAKDYHLNDWLRMWLLLICMSFKYTTGTILSDCQGDQ